MKDYTSIFRAYSNEISLRIMKLLVETSDSICVCEFSFVFHRPIYEVSKVLKLLRKSGFVTPTRKGKYIFYHISDINDPFKLKVLEALGQMKCEMFDSDIIVFKKMRREGKIPYCPYY